VVELRYASGVAELRVVVEVDVRVVVAAPVDVRVVAAAVLVLKGLLVLLVDIAKPPLRRLAGVETPVRCCVGRITNLL
jgi:hypothetical protein